LDEGCAAASAQPSIGTGTTAASLFTGELLFARRLDGLETLEERKEGSQAGFGLCQQLGQELGSCSDGHSSANHLQPAPMQCRQYQQGESHDRRGSGTPTSVGPDRQPGPLLRRTGVAGRWSLQSCGRTGAGRVQSQ
jgi:hypothetical protein